jgi:hypothetical protein
MFVAFMLLHFLLCDEVLPYFILRVVVFCNLNLNLNLYKGGFKVNPANPARVKGEG